MPYPLPKSIIYIDGFNFYYGAVRGGPHKWLDLQKFFTLLRSNDNIRQIHYFTAYVNGPKRADQGVFLRALASCPLVNIVLGRFKTKRVKCTIPPCLHTGDRWMDCDEEKRTDVNIALQMVEDAYENRCERFVLVSGDSDSVPAVSKVRTMGKEVIVYIPARDKQRAAAVELRSAASRAKELPLNLLQFSHLPALVPDGAGGFLTKPVGW